MALVQLFTTPQNTSQHNIPCSDCSWSYVGETGRSFGTRKKKHIRNVKSSKKGSNIAKHAWDMDHIIDFDNGKVIDRGNYRTRKTLESWHTAIIANSDNNSKPLPKQYAMLVNKKMSSLDASIITHILHFLLYIYIYIT